MSVQVQYVEKTRWFVELDGDERGLFQEILKGGKWTSAEAFELIIMSGMVHVKDRLDVKGATNELEGKNGGVGRR